MKKKMWSVLLALCLALSLLPTAALADDTPDADTVAKIGDTGYTTLAEAVKAAESKESAVTIELLKDASGDGVVFEDSKFANGLTIDFGGHTYTVSGNCVGSTGTQSNGFQILKGSNVTLENGTLKTSSSASGTHRVNGNSESYTGGAMILVMNYSDLTLDNMTLDGTTLYTLNGTKTTYTLSNVCGKVKINNSTITGQTGGFAFDVDYKVSDYSAGTQVTVSGNSTILGNIEIPERAQGNNCPSTLTISGGSFTDLATAVKYATDGATISLASDVTVDANTVLNKSLTVQLNGHKLSRDNGNGIFQITNNKTLTIDGTKAGSQVYGRLDAGIGTDNNGNIVLNGGYYICKDNNQTVLHINGTCKNSNVTIKNATIVSPTDNGIQLNGAGTFLIENSSITGGTAVYIKSGNLTVKNSTLTGTLSPVNYTYNGNGAYPTGDALVVDCCGYPGGAPTITIESGSFTATKSSIGLYEYGTHEGHANITVTGGTFSADPSAYVSDDYNIRVNNDGTYTVVLNSGLGAGTYLRQPAVSSECVWNQSGSVYNVYVFTAPAPSNPVAPSTPTQPTEPDEPTEPSTPTSYPDVAPTAWYAPAVAFVTEKGLMSGTESGFEPDSTATRAMVWMILARLDGKDGGVEGDEWFTAAQLWSISAGISDGSDPHGTITREQLAVMLYRYAISVGLDVSVGANTNILSYGDAASVSDFAMEAMQWACGAGIINGVNGNLDPQGNATRAQLATMLMRYVALFD